MAPAFDHLLLTRFSAVMAPGAPPAGEHWLRYRLHPEFERASIADAVRSYMHNSKPEA